jgi:hypothetical protein
MPRSIVIPKVFFLGSAVAFLTIATLFTGQARAQVSGATLSGTVTDPSGAVIAAAQVSILNKATGITRTATTDSAGLFAAPNLQPGLYEVTVAAAGFSTTKQENITLTVGAQQVLDVSLKIGTAEQTVLVTEAAQAVQLGTSTISSEIQSKQVLDMPLNGRDWTSLATLSPGVNAIETQMAFETGTPRGNRGFGSQLTISGGRPTQNNYRLDGNSINDYSNGGPGSVIGVSLGVDAIQEFSVLTGNYSAEYGRTSGGVVNAISKSGTNAFHGDLYEFLRNQKLDANDFFSNSSRLPKAVYRRNQFGAAAGGPIRKDRTFIFGDYEGIRQSQGIAQASSVPSDAARLGNMADGSHINVSPIITKYLGIFPHANGAVNGDKGIFAFAGARIVTENFYTFRADHRISDKDSLFGTYMYDKAPYDQPDQFDYTTIESSTARQIAALEENHIFSPSLANTARIGYNRNVVVNFQQTAALNPLATDPSLAVMPGGFSPDTRISGINTHVGGVNNGFSHHNWNSYQAYDDAFLTRGTHSLKFGFALENMRYNAFSSTSPYGILRFKSLTDFLNNNAFSLEAGLPNSITPRGYRQTIVGGYIQDDWKLRKNLTVNIGLRYEMDTVLTETHGQLTNLRNITDPLPYCGTADPARTRIVTPANPAGTPGCTGVAPYYSNPTKLNFEPRFGFAWDPRGNGKTAIRGGFAIFDILPLPGYQFTQQGQETPFFLKGLVTSDVVPIKLGVDPLSPSSAYSHMGAGSLLAAFQEPNPRRNYIEQWNINIQHQITNTITASVGYIGSHGVHMMFRGDDGDMVIPTKTSAGYLWPMNATPQDKINPNFGGVREIFYNASSEYAGLLVSVQKRFGHGVQFGGSYTWSKATDDSSATVAGDTFSNSVTSWFWFAPSISHARADFDVTHSASLNGTWQLPGSHLRGPVGGIVGGWQLGGIVKLNSGVPTTPLIGPDPLGIQNVGSDVFSIPNLIPGCDPVNHNFKSNPGGVFLGYINYSCFQLPQATPEIAARCRPFSATLPGTCANLLGNAGRNSIIGPSLTNVDFSLIKNIPVKKISESFNVQFRAEFFNIFNHANFAPPLPFNGSGQAQIFLASGASAKAGGLQSLVTLPRDIQFALKVIW